LNNIVKNKSNINNFLAHRNQPTDSCLQFAPHLLHRKCFALPAAQHTRPPRPWPVASWHQMRLPRRPPSRRSKCIAGYALTRTAIDDRTPINRQKSRKCSRLMWTRPNAAPWFWMRWLKSRMSRIRR
jgi:hypothetical protein